MAQKLKAVLFDLDGTLIRTFIDFPAMRRDVQQMARDQFRANDKVLQNSDSLDIIAATLSTLPEEQRNRARRELYAVLEKHEEAGCEHPEAIPGAVSLLRDLRKQSIGIAIVTRNARRIATALCHHREFTVDVIVAREDTTTYKPHPEPIHVACAQLFVSPQSTAMVGDLWADIAAGINADCATTIGIQWSHDPPNRFERTTPDYIVSTLEEAGAILLPAVH